MNQSKITIEILRSNPQDEQQPAWQAYTIPYVEKNTILGALMFIQAELDPTLAFRYSCRFKRCGLCAVEIDGKSRMACHTYVQDGMRIGPLAKLPIIKDLVIDRESFFQTLSQHQLYLANPVNPNLPVKEPEQGGKLRSCTECLSCLAACQRYNYGNTEFAGPYLFVKLAQLHLDPRDHTDRIRQAGNLGIAQCRECRQKCACPNGIAIYRDAIKLLLEANCEGK